MIINVDAPHPPSKAVELDGYGRYTVTGVDAKTGRIESFTNAKFYWSVDGKRQLWSIAGSAADYALATLDSYEVTA